MKTFESNANEQQDATCFSFLECFLLPKMQNDILSCHEIQSGRETKFAAEDTSRSGALPNKNLQDFNNVFHSQQCRTTVLYIWVLMECGGGTFETWLDTLGYVEFVAMTRAPRGHRVGFSFEGTTRRKSSQESRNRRRKIKEALTLHATVCASLLDQKIMVLLAIK